jgi:hypothetical protein
VLMLHRSTTFAQLPEYKLVWLAQVFQVRTLRPGEAHACTKHEEAWLPVEGLVEARFTAEAAVSLETGALAIAGVQVPAPTEIVALQDCRLLVARKADLLDLLAADAQLIKALVEPAA